MKSSKLLFSLLTLVCAVTAQAQMYKWVGPDGKITYSDAPPPSTAKQMDSKSLSSGGVSTADLPYQVAEAVRNNPVKLYTTASCQGCDEGRKLLNARGIPFSEKTVSNSADIEQMRQISGGEPKFPLITIGRKKIVGFESGNWNMELNVAGYPTSNQLPKTYRNASAESLAAPSPKAPDPQKSKPDTPPPAATAPPPPTGNAPPGFRF